MRLLYLLRKNRFQAGLSLLEVMVAVVVLSIVLFVGIPGFQALFESARERSAASSFVTALSLARSEALTRNAFTRVCIASACGDGVNQIRVEVEGNGGAQTLLRAWDTETGVAYKNGEADGFSVRFSSLGLVVDAKGDQLKAALDVSIMDTTEDTPQKMTSYCVGVTGSVSKGGCN